MKKLLLATILLVSAALTETPEDYILGGCSDACQIDTYLSAWANANTEEVQFNDDLFVDDPALEIHAEGIHADAAADSGIAL
jgi:hypothetical protein